MFWKLALILPFAIFAVVALAVVAVVAWPHKVLGVGEATLAYSVQQEIGFEGGSAECRERKKGFTCVLDRQPGSDGTEYLISVDNGCWQARLPGAKRSKRLRGCLGLDDYVRIPSQLN